MEVKTVPWWRKALSYALDGIRTGFGLFSRSAKNNAVNEPEKFAGQEVNPEEEAELNEHSPKLEPIAEAVNEPEVIPAPETAVTPEPPAEAAPQPALTASVPQPEPEPETTVEVVCLNEPMTESVPEEPAQEFAAQSEAPEEPTPQPEIPDDLAASVEVVCLPAPEDEPISEAEAQAASIVGEEAPSQIAAAGDSDSELLVLPVESTEPQAEDAPEQLAEQPEAVEEEPADEALPVAESAPDAEQTDAQQPAKPISEPVESVCLSAPENESMSEDKAQDESLVEEEAPSEIAADDSVPEHLVSSVESMEPQAEDAPEQIAEQPEAVEEEPVDEALPVAKSEPDAEQTDAQQPAKPITEPVESVCLSAPEGESMSEDKAQDESLVEEEAPSEIAAGDSGSELLVLPVESMEPQAEDAPEQIAEQPEAVEEEPVDEALPVAKSEPEAEQPIAAQPAESGAEEATPSAPQAEEEEAVSTEKPAAEQPVEEPIIGKPIIEEPSFEKAAEPVAAAEEPVSVAPPVAESTIEPVVAPAASPAPVQAASPVQQSAPPAAAPPAKPFIKLESRDNQADLSPFSVVVSQVYDGPLDLLLDLIRKQDIDIYDIPIARITAQFLAYVNQLKATDVDVAGEFIYTASLLIHIKSKMLLPRAPSGPDDAAEDPRRELVERLLEHERFKNAAQMLQQKQMLEAATWTNPGMREFQDDASAEPEIAADTVDLVRIFRDILERARSRPVINLKEDSVTVGQMIQFLARRLTMEDKPVALRRLLSHTRSERALIAMFLALLELVRLQAILLRQDRAFSEIFIKKHTGFDSVMNEGLANARDDWR